MQPSYFTPVTDITLHYTAALLVHGCDYNISSSLDLLFFSQSRLSFPFIDRLKDGKTAFGYQPFDLIDNPVAVLALVGTSGAIPVPASIQPPGISQQAAVAGDDGILHFSAQGLLANASESPAALNAGLLASVITATFSVSSGLGPWSAEAYEASGNLPMFGPNTPLGTCFLVKALFDSLTCMYADRGPYMVCLASRMGTQSLCL